MRYIIFCDHYHKMSGGQYSLISLINILNKNSDLLNSNTEYWFFGSNQIENRYCNSLKKNKLLKLKYFPFPTESLNIRNLSFIKIFYKSFFSFLEIYLQTLKFLSYKNKVIFHCNTYYSLFLIVALKIILYFCKIKIIFRARTIPQRGLLYPLNLLFLLFTNKILSNSKYVHSTLPPYIKKKSEIIYNHIKRPSIDKNFQIKESSFIPYFLYLGRITPRKKVDILIKSFNQLKIKNINLLIVGEQNFKSNYFKNKIKSLVSNNKNIILLDHQDKIGNLIKNSIAIVLPSEEEPLSRIVIETMLMGKIIIANNSGGNKEVIQNGKTGFLFKKNNHFDLLKNLKNVYFMDLNKKQNICKEAQFYAEKEFDRRNTSFKEIDLLNKL